MIFRQDQLIIQIITLMDKCLRKENLDLRLTTYKVLATSTSQGFVQFIDSQPLRDVLHDWNSIQVNFFEDRKIFSKLNTISGIFSILSTVAERTVRYRERSH